MMELSSMLATASLALLLMTHAARATLASVVIYDNFDEYLLAIGKPSERTHNEVIKVPVGHRTVNATKLETGLDIIGYFKDVPRRHWSCCMLGKLAGDKGFSCQTSFYSARLRSRNVNRAHNRRLPFHGSDRVDGWVREIMATFGRCVDHQSTEFHQCCYSAVTEMQERRRWHRYRVRATAAPTVTGR